MALAVVEIVQVFIISQCVVVRVAMGAHIALALSRQGWSGVCGSNVVALSWSRMGTGAMRSASLENASVRQRGKHECPTPFDTLAADPRSVNHNPCHKSCTQLVTNLVQILSPSRERVSANATCPSFVISVICGALQCQVALNRRVWGSPFHL